MKAVAVAAVLSPAFALASPRLGLDVESGATHVLMSRDPLIENSCKDLSLSSDHTVLNGQCLNSKNQWQSTSIGLSTCIANNDGVLRPARGGQFAVSCDMRHCGLLKPGTKYVFACDSCKNFAGELGHTSIELDMAVYNLWGNFHCSA